MRKVTLRVFIAAILLCAVTAGAQKPTDSCGPAKVIPPSGEEPPAKIFVDPPLPGPLASRGVAIIHYCAQNLRLLPVFGPTAVTASPRIGHVHARVDGSAWVWAEASGNPVILLGLSPGRHEVLLVLMDANHRKLDAASVAFVVPEKGAAEKHH